MGMNTPKSPQPAPTCPVTGEIGNQNSTLIADNYKLNLPFSVNENSQLSPDFKGGFYQKTGSFG
jgi:hypothetical protein